MGLIQINMKFKKVIESLFTPEECQALITVSEQMGFEASLVRTRQGEIVDKNMRDNDRVVFDDTELRDFLWEKIQSEVPEIDGWKPYGLNERLRYYRYKDGQQFKPHVDGSHKIAEGDLSLVTMLVYLNEDFDGGETTFVIEFQKIKPKIGMVLLFDHKILHSGMPVTNGTKYVLRTDVMYKKS